MAMIKYPKELVCPFCSEKLKLDIKKGIAFTNDIISIRVMIPTSNGYGKDSMENNQKLKKTGAQLTVCNKCGCIISQRNLLP